MPNFYKGQKVVFMLPEGRGCPRHGGRMENGTIGEIKHIFKTDDNDIYYCSVDFPTYAGFAVAPDEIVPLSSLVKKHKKE